MILQFSSETDFFSILSHLALYYLSKVRSVLLWAPWHTWKVFAERNMNIFVMKLFKTFGSCSQHQNVCEKLVSFQRKTREMLEKIRKVSVRKVTATQGWHYTSCGVNEWVNARGCLKFIVEIFSLNMAKNLVTVAGCRL